MSILGPFGKTLETYFDRNEEFKNIKFPRVDSHQTLEKRYKGLASKQMIDLMKRLLEIDDNKRITASEALKHPYLAELYAKDLELQKEYSKEDKENIASASHRVEGTKLTEDKKRKK